MKRVLLIGGSGQLGTAIAQSWTECEIVAPPHAELGIEETGRLEDFLERVAPDIVVNAAAFHDVDRCESEPERAVEINALAVGRAAEAAARRDAVFLTVSTDYVFDGQKRAPYGEADMPNPLSAYGRSKLAGERLVAASGARAFVVRTCGVYGASRSAHGRRTFIDRILASGDTGRPAKVVTDVVVSPTFAGHLAAALRRLVGTEAYGLYHAAAGGAVAWYDFAVEAARQAGAAVRVEPIASRELKAPAQRPPYSALDSSKLLAMGIVLPSWRDGIAAYLGPGVR